MYEITCPICLLSKKYDSLTAVLAWLGEHMMDAEWISSELSHGQEPHDKANNWKNLSILVTRE